MEASEVHNGKGTRDCCEAWWVHTNGVWKGQMGERTRVTQWGFSKVREWGFKNGNWEISTRKKTYVLQNEGGEKEILP